MKERIAIIGTGVAGLGCAHHLRERADLTLFEQNRTPGGHTNTVVVREGEASLPIDTGFIVFNKVTYPNLCRLFDELGVETKPSEMSFSVRHDPAGLEYNGMGFNKVFAQRSNLLRPRFLAFLANVMRFFKVANATLSNPDEESLTLRAFVERHRLGRDFLDWYLAPMSSAVWSTESHDVLDFPASTLIRFFHNHGFLGVSTHHPWFTVRGGAKTYVDKILAGLRPPRLSDAVVRVEESASSARIVTASGHAEAFDRVVLASHADQSLALLASPDADQQRLLAPFRYQKNHATLHTDPSVMPRRRRAWASWNYRVAADRSTTHYWMNALQGVSDRTDYFVSLNSADRIDPAKVLYETDYDHPIFTREAIAAQHDLHRLNTRSREQRVYFCGSYFKYGFHEDAYSSALYLSRLIAERLAA